MEFFENIIWRLKCPHSVDEIAEHFIANYIPTEYLGTYDFSGAFTDFQDPWFAYRRMLANIYGVSDCYKPPDDSPSQPSWNRKLRLRYPDLDPEGLVELVFTRMLDLLKAADNKACVRTRSPLAPESDPCE